jgi:ABC-2 type transport system permease protein
VIGTVFNIALLRLWNNKQELLLALIVPILFFSIFALIFGRGIGSGTDAVQVTVVDDDRSSLTQAVARFLQNQDAIQFNPSIFYTNQQWPLKKLTRSVIRESSTDVVVCLPAGMEHQLQSQTEVAVQILSEGSNPVARQIVSAIVSQAIATATVQTQPDRFTSYTGVAGASGHSQRRLPSGSSLPAPHGRSVEELVNYQAENAFANDKHNPKIAMYAAGIAVMFLLFSATGAGGSILEEHEAGTLDRLLSSQLSVTELLAGKWLFITALGCVQLSVMFAWAEAVFGVDVRGHLTGFAVMTICTAAATASLALCLAVLCRSRAQLNGISIVLILTMSALGGSMVPRYIMSEEMRRWGQLTFNAWALDGFKKVFWYDLPVAALHVEVSVLLCMTVALAVLARVFADRWEVN